MAESHRMAKRHKEAEKEYGREKEGFIRILLFFGIHSNCFDNIDKTTVDFDV